MAHLWDKNPADENGFTPLHEAAVQGQLQVCNYIMAYLKNKNPGDNQGQTPLHKATFQGNLDICKAIMKKIHCS